MKYKKEVGEYNNWLGHSSFMARPADFKRVLSQQSEKPSPLDPVNQAPVTKIPDASLKPAVRMQ